ncbi:MAG: hypothetical protein KY432_09175 [Acidobacteria bacterium]|nr:hypothetical protein [Acidobacteriota bacterium]
MTDDTKTLDRDVPDVEKAHIEEIAEELGVESSTARSHLKRVFTKTDTHRQSDLVRLLMQGLSRLTVRDPDKAHALSPK